MWETSPKNQIHMDLFAITGSKKNNITLQGGDVAAAVFIKFLECLGRGVANTDAANVSQSESMGSPSPGPILMSVSAMRFHTANHDTDTVAASYPL